jgi:hypothetical protein
VVHLLADLLVVPALVLQVLVAAMSVLLVDSAAVLVSGLVLGSEATRSVSLRAHLAAAQALAQVDLVVVLPAHLRVQADLAVVPQQVAAERRTRCKTGNAYLIGRPLGSEERVIESLRRRG